jgi:hypothetical protein
MSHNYRLPSDVHTETNYPGLGALVHDFKAGVVTPKSEEEQIALDALVDSGIAVVEDNAGTKKPSTKVAEPSTTDLPSEA